SCMTSQPVFCVLLIEDNPGDATLVKDMLASASDAVFQVHWANALLPGLDRTLQHAIVRERTRVAASPIDSRQESAVVVGILGAKGGVGTTTVACHLG